MKGEENRTIKPIETEYNGYKFRSRLEARWAVFFDEIRVKYEYEPEGYEMSDGTKYLPDFYFPDFDYYAEVKGYVNGICEDIRRVVSFVETKKTSVIILSKIPYDPESKGLFWFPAIHFKHGHYRTFSSHVFFTYYEGEAWLEDDTYIGRKQVWRWWYCNDNDLYKSLQAKNGSEIDDFRPTINDDGSLSPPYMLKEAFDVQFIEYALAKARQARFEHGEKPKTRKGVMTYQ